MKLVILLAVAAAVWGVDHEPVWVNDAWSCAGISQNRAHSCQKVSLEPEEALSRLGSSLGTGNSPKKQGSCTSSEELTGTKGSGYRGCQQKTRGGFTRQDWSLQSPHKHSNTPSAKPGKGLEGAYCRNPGKSDTIWCYTTSNSKRWEYCDPKTKRPTKAPTNAPSFSPSGAPSFPPSYKPSTAPTHEPTV